MKMNSFLNRITNMTLVAMLSFTAFLSQGTVIYADDIQSSEYYVDKETDHAKIKYSDMDLADLVSYGGATAAIADLELKIQTSGKDAEVEESFKEVLKQTDIIRTYYTIVESEYYKDISDSEALDRVTEVETNVVEIMDYAANVLSKMMDTEYAHIMEDAFSVEDAESFVNLSRNTPEEMLLIDENANLLRQYEAATSDIELVISDEDYETVSNIFINLVTNNKKIAEIEGYDSVVEHIYKGYYRDYSPEDTRVFKEQVKNYVVPLKNKIEKYMNEHPITLMEFSFRQADSADVILEKLGEILPKIHPELKTAYDYMMEYDLCYLADLPEGVSLGYTERLAYYGVPYIMNDMSNTVDDYTDTIHEFGHFNSQFHVVEYSMNAGSSLDVAEVQSQGLELLALEYASELYGEKFADIAVYAQLDNMMNAVIEGCIQDEFQQRAYEEENPTPSTLENLYIDIKKEYGTDDGDGKSWINIGHTFNSPFYYISYATSAVAALDLYVLSLEDRDAAVDAYMRISALEGYDDLADVMDIIGSGSIMEEGAVEKMCDSLTKKIDNRDITGGKSNMGMEESVIIVIVAACVGGFFLFVAFALLAVVIVLANKNKNKKKLIQKLEAENDEKLQTILQWQAYHKQEKAKWTKENKE